MPDSTKQGLDEQPPSAKLVYFALKHNGGLTQKALADETMLPTRTVRYALNRLEAIGVVEENVYFPDARHKLYTLTDTVVTGDPPPPSATTDGR